MVPNSVNGVRVVTVTIEPPVFGTRAGKAEVMFIESV
jgi:hypothetical protein